MAIENLNVGIVKPTHSVILSQEGEALTLIEESGGCAISVYKKQIHISCTRGDQLSFYTTKDSWSHSGTFTTTVIVDIPELAFVRDGFIDYTVYSSNDIVSTGRTFIKGTDFCTNAPLLTQWMTIECWPWWMWLVWVVLSFCVIGFVALYIRSLIYIFNIIIYPLKIIFKQLYKLCKRKNNNNYNEIDNDVEVGNEEVKLLSRNRKDRSRSSFWLVIMLIACCSACDDSNVLGSQHANCVLSGQNYKCTMTADYLMTFEGPNYKGCLYFKDDKDNLLGHLEISLTNITKVYDVEQIYSTSSWKGRTYSHSECWTAGNWCKEDRCNSIVLDDPHLDGLIPTGGDPNLVDYAGRSGCNVYSCTFADVTGCNAYRWTLLPVSPFADVFQPTSNKIIHFFNITFCGSDGELKETKLWDGQTQFKLDAGFKFSLSSATTLPEITLGDRKMMKFEDGSVGTVIAAETGSPADGIVGDIQYGSIPMGKGDVDGIQHMLFDSQLIETTANSDKRSWTFKEPGMDNRNWTMFPSVHDGYVMHTNQAGQLVASITSLVPVNIAFSTYKDVVLETRVSYPIPEAEHISVTGCYSCNRQAMLTFYAWSKSIPGSVHVISDELGINAGIMLTTEKQEFSIKFAADKTSINALVSLYSGTLHYDFTAEGVLKEESEVPQHESVETTTDGIPNDNVTHNYGFRTSYIVTIIIYIASALVILLVIRWLWMRRKAKSKEM
jgi:hypothetical protein